MTNKIISLGTLLALFAVMLIALLRPADPLFYFISLDPATSLVRLLFVVAMVAVAFKAFSSHLVRRATALTGLGIIGLVVASFSFGSVYNLFSGYFMPLDFLVMLQSGIVFSSAAIDKQIQIKPKHRETQGVRIPVRVSA